MGEDPTTRPTVATAASDGALLSHFVEDGDAQAFEAIVRRHSTMVLGVCRRVTGDEHDAEDAAQAAFVALAMKARSLRKTVSVGAWLHHVARQVSMDLIRRRQRLQKRQQEAAKMARGLSVTVPAEPAIDAGELRRILDEHLDKLPEKYRLPIIMHHLEGLTQEQAAEALGCPPGTVAVRLHRGRELLRKRLGRGGLAAGAGALALALPAAASAAAATATFISSTTTLAATAATGGTAALAATASTTVAGLAQGAIHTMLIGKIKTMAAVVLAGISISAGLLAAGGKLDLYGDKLPADASSRLGTVRLRNAGGDIVNSVAGLTMSADGTRLASVGAWGRTLYVWDAKTGAEVAAITPEGGKGGMYWPGLSPDGNTAYAIVVGGVVLGTNNINYWLVGWDVGTAAETFRIEARGPMATSPDGKLAAAASSQDMGSVDVIDLKTGRAIHSLKGHHVAMPQYRTSAVRDLAWSADGTTLLSGGDDNQVVVWDARSGKIRGKMAGNLPPQAAPAKSGQRPAGPSRGSAYPIAVSADGLMIAGPSTGVADAVVRRISDGKVLHALVPEDDPVAEPDKSKPGGPPRIKRTTTGIALSADGALVATSSTDRVIRLFNLATGKLARRIETTTAPPSVPGRTVLFGKDGKTLWCASGDKAIQAYDVATGKPRFEHLGPEGPVGRVAFSPDGTRVAVVGWDTMLRLYDAAGGRQLWSVFAHKGPSMACVFSPDGNDIFTGGGDGRILCWDARTGKLRRHLTQLAPTGGRGLPTIADDMAISPDGKTLVLDLSWRAALMPTGGESAAQPKGLPLFGPRVGGTFCNVAITADGKTVIAGCNGSTVFTWDLVADPPAVNPRWRAQGVESHFVEARPTADGRFVVGVGAGCRDLLIWDLATGRELLRTRLFALPQPGPWVSMRLTPDDRLAFVSVGQDIVAVELLSGKIVRTLKGHRGNVTTLDISRDGRLLASGSMDATVLTWDLRALTCGPSTPTSRPSAEELPKLWETMAGDDAAAAWEATRRLSQAGDEATALVGRNVAPVKADAKARDLIAQIESPKFAEREEAYKSLTELGESAVETVKQALAGTVPAETRQRLETFLDQFEKLGLVSGPKARELRAVAVLEWIGSESARKLLKELAAGAAGAKLTLEAKAALERLNRKPLPSRS